MKKPKSIPKYHPKGLVLDTSLYINHGQVVDADKLTDDQYRTALTIGVGEMLRRKDLVYDSIKKD